MTLNSFCSSSQLTTLLPERSLLKGNLSGSTLLATILGQEKFSVNNKRQNIEQVGTLAQGVVEAVKIMAATTGYSKVILTLWKIHVLAACGAGRKGPTTSNPGT